MPIYNSYMVTKNDGDRFSSFFKLISPLRPKIIGIIKINLFRNDPPA